MRIALGIPLSFSDLIKHGEAFSKDSYNGLITHITTDSREASEGDLFFSFASDRESGEEHIKEAHKKGAKSVSSFSKSASFLVSDTEKALLSLASFYKSKLKHLKAIVAITGSVGKTTTKEFCASFFSVSYKTHKTYMNYNNTLGVSLSLLSAPQDTEILVLELGMNALGEIKELSEAVKPDYAVITNIGNAHIGKLGSLQLIAEAKLEIAKGMTEERIIAPKEEALLSKAKYKFSLSDKNSDYYLCKTNDTESFAFYHNSKKLIDFNTDYKTSHHLKALLIALALSNLLGFNNEQMLDGIKNCSSVKLRQKLIDFKHFSVFDDTYSSSPEAVKADIEYLKLEYPKRRFSVALGDMLELGHKTEELHKQIGKLAYAEGARKLYAFGAYAYLIRDGAKEAGMKENDITASTELDDYPIIAKEIYQNSEHSEIVLVKASHALLSGKIIEEIERLDKEC